MPSQQRGHNRSRHVQLEIPTPELLPKQPDDEGALAQARFEFQAAIGARWFLNGLNDGQLISIGCEGLEDLVVQTIHGIALVDVKHREPNRGPWTLEVLCSEGGLAHLFDRWIYSTDKMADVESFHISNAGLRTGAWQVQKLSDLCDSPSPSPGDVLAFARHLTCRFLTLREKTGARFERIPRRPAPARPEELAADDELILLCSDFIRSLSFVNVPHRDQIGAVTVAELVLPYLRRHGMDGHSAQDCYDALVKRIYKASRTFGDRRIDLVHRTVGTGTSLADAQHQSQVAARTITVDVAREALHNGGASPLFPPNVDPLDAPGGADLLRKMRDGEISHTQRRFAERARSAWYTTWSTHRLDLPGDAAALQGIELQVIQQVIDAQRAARAAGEPYGQALFDALRDTVRVEDFADRPQLRMNNLHALGVAFNLCDACDFDFQPTQRATEVDPTL
ncbi:hypothetical protein [Actinospica robiniae]|uniref:hypothetical protein n=1 Tax=Actinospica robiniae TaxID=304901 RepID=UPI00040E086B|nr:hypothetical protein [Actinospica robiniae]